MNRKTTSRVTRSFFERNTVVVARALLGNVLVSHIGGVRTSGRIVECEAYTPDDSTSHTFRGRTHRNASMFEPAGTVYVYFTYGMHYCMNVVTEAEGIGAAVLIRALEPIDGVEAMRERRGDHASLRDLCRGPARLCVALGVGGDIDGIDLCGRDAVMRIESGASVSRARIRVGPRVGVAGTDADVRLPRRFYVADSRHVSNGPRKTRARPREIV